MRGSVRGNRYFSDVVKPCSEENDKDLIKL